MTTVNAKTEISFTPQTLVATFGFVLLAAGWCWRMDARTSAHEETNAKLQASVEKVERDVATVKAELGFLRRGGYTLTPTDTPVSGSR